MKPLIAVLDFIFISRPLLLVPVWGFSAFGFFAGTHVHTPSFTQSLQITIYSFHHFAWMFIFSLAVGAVYILNQIADIVVDRDNVGFPLLARGAVSLSVAWIAIIIYSACAIAIPLFYNHKILTWLAVATLLLGSHYSFRPTFFSGRPILDFLSNATGFGIIAFGAGWYCSGTPLYTATFFLSAIPYFLLMCAGSISSTLPDFASDKKWHKTTTAVFMGIRGAHLLAFFILISAGIFALYCRDYVAVTCAIISLPFYIFYSVTQKVWAMEATYKAGGGSCMLAAGILFPTIIVPSLALFAATVIYFRYRHHVRYPSLTPVTYE